MYSSFKFPKRIQIFIIKNTLKGNISFVPVKYFGFFYFFYVLACEFGLPY